MEKKIHKKEYAPPVLRVSEFRVEHGFAASNLSSNTEEYGNGNSFWGASTVVQTENYSEGSSLWGGGNAVGTESYGDGANIGW